MRVKELFLGAALLLSSAGGLVVEIVAGRLIAPYVGMSLYTWTAIIAVVLAGLSGGHWIGGRMAGRDASDAKLARGLAIALGLAAVSTLAVLVLVRVLSGPLLSSGMGPVWVVVVLAFSLFFLPSLFVGVVAPVLTKLAVDARPDQPGPVIGRMYALGTLGSIAGTLGAGYFFISWIGSIGTLVTVAAVYAVLAVGFAASNRIGDGAWTAGLLAVAAAAITAPADKVLAFTSPCTVESDYFCIRIDDFSGQSGRPSTLMALDHLVHSINDRADAGLLYSPYIHFVDEYTRQRLGAEAMTGNFRAFFIGGGGYSLPRAWAAGFPGARLTVAEIDPTVTEAARAGMWLDTRHSALDIRHLDARALLQSLPAARQFDVVFGDAFHDISVPSHLVSREFHAEIAKRLKPGGFYTVNVVDHGGEPRFLASLVKTLQLDFDAVEVWAEAEELDGAIARAGQRVTYNVVASMRDSDRKRVLSRIGLERLWLRWPTADMLERTRGRALVLTDDFAPVDRLMSTLLNQPEF